jgi:hypothetical protein
MNVAKTVKLIIFLLLPLTLTPFSEEKVNAQSKVADSLKPPLGQVLFLKAKAKGVQIYQCSVSPNNSKQFEWILKAPKADLLDDKGRKIVQHFAGPTWKATDGSSVVGQVKAKVAAPSSSAIPWLLLTAKTHAGVGILRKVASIQRLDTQGGKAPSKGCNAQKLNTEIQVNYQATYYFYHDLVSK